MPPSQPAAVCNAASTAQLQRLRLMAEASRVFAEARPDAREIGQLLVDRVIAEIAHSCVLRLVSPDGRWLDAIAWGSSVPEASERIRAIVSNRHAVDEGLAGRVFQTGQPMLLREVDPAALRTMVAAHQLPYVDTAPEYSAIGTPLRSRGRTLGTIMVGRHSLRGAPNRPFDTDDVAMLQELADRAALAIDSALALSRAEALTRNIERLHAITAALSRAATVQDVANAVSEEGLRAFGADFGGVALASAGGGWLEALTRVNVDDDTASRWARVPVSEVAPAMDAFRLGRALYFESRAEMVERYPALREEAERTGAEASAFIPLRVGEAPIGMVAFTWRRARSFDDQERALLETLGRQAAIVLERARLYERATETAEREQFLGEAGAILASSLEYETTLANIARLCVPRVADWCAVDIVDDDGALHRVAVEHPDPERRALAFELTRRYPTVLDPGRGIGKALATGEPELAPEITDDMLAAIARDPEHLALLRQLGLRSYIIAPLIAGGAARGAITVFWAESGRRYSPDDLRMMAELGRRAGAAYENARLFREANRAMATARDNERRFRGIYDTEMLSIAFWNDAGVIVDANDAFLALFGRGRDELEAGRLTWQQLTPPRFREADRRAFAALAARGVCTPYEKACYHRDGREIPILVGGGRLEDGHAVAFVFDMSDRKRAEQEREALVADLERARGEAEAANRAKDEFLAMLGHELRNPLAPIVTALQLMQMHAPDVAVKERQVIERQVDHLSALVDDLLDVSRIARGKIELRRKLLDIGDVIGKAIETVSPLLEQRAHQLQMRLDRGRLFVEGDETRLAQVVANLLANAAKYTPRNGHIEVSADVDGDRVVIRVRDDGMGIAPELLPAVFERFVQGKQSVDRALGGLGLGLTIVRSLVLLHGGTVDVHSEGPGKGSEFTVRLPRARRHGAEEGTSPSGVSPLIADRRMRILVVDDNRDVADTLADGLRLIGHEVAVAYDGVAALSTATGFRPDVVLLDLGLPVMDGFEVASRMRETLAAHPPLLIAITGYGLDSDRARTREAGFAHHLVKPVELASLLAVLQSCRDPREARPRA